MTYTAEVLADSPLAYWRMGEASGNFADSSGNSRTLVANGSPGYSLPSLIVSDTADDAAYFDPNGAYGERASDATLAQLTAWTVEAWIRPSATTWDGEGAAVCSEYSGGAVAFALRTPGSSPLDIQAAFYDGGWQTATATSPLAISTDYHVVGTYDGTTLKLYINGSLDASTTVSTSMSPTATSTYVGRRWDDPNVNLWGDIDEVAIYSGALSAGRIAAHYAAATSTSGPAEAFLSSTSTLSASATVFDPTVVQRGRAYTFANIGVGAVASANGVAYTTANIGAKPPLLPLSRPGSGWGVITDTGEVYYAPFGSIDAFGYTFANVANVSPATDLVATSSLSATATLFTTGAATAHLASSSSMFVNGSVSTPGGGGGPELRLTWAPPTLVSPTTITLTNANRKANMDPTKDYIVLVPSTIDVSGGIELNGGRNVRLIGGKIQFSQVYATTTGGLGSANRAVYIKGNSAQTVPRTVHVEGLWIAGPHTYEGINIDAQSEPGLTVQLQNIRVDTVNTLLPGDGSHQGGDAMQNWNGPYQLRIDRFTVANSGYQGFFFQSKKFGTGPTTTSYFKNINIDGSAYVSPAMPFPNPRQGSNTSAYLLWHAYPSTVPIVVTNCYIKKNPALAWPNGVIWPKDGNATWGAIQGSPPGGDFVPASRFAGGYASPGYL